MITALALMMLIRSGTAQAMFQTCEEGARFEPVPGDCGYFVACVGQKGYKMPCPNNLVFSLSEERCVYTSVESMAECLQYDTGIVEKDESSVGLLGDAAERADARGNPRREAENKDDNVRPEDRTRANQGRRADMEDKTRKATENLSDNERPRDRRVNDQDDRQNQKPGNRVRSDSKEPGDKMADDTADIGDMADVFDDQEGLVGIAREQRCLEGVRMAPHDTLCHHYFDCSVAYEDQPIPFFQPYERECPYPQQFSTETNQCEDFEKVDCGQRQEFADACDYSFNKCWGPNCRSCQSQFASCRDQPDGIMDWPGREGTGFWVECRGQRTVAQGECGSDNMGRMKVFNGDMGKCVMYYEVVSQMCQWTDGAYDLPHYSDCHKYYDCTNSSGKSAKTEDDLVRVCPYPQLFSVRTAKCEDFEQVDCGSRREVFTPCDYIKCEDPNLASCFGFPDGDNVCRTKEGSPHYVTCKAQRTVAKHMCPVDNRGLFMQFAPGARQCMPVDASTSA
ncbi:chitin binding beak protein 1 [Plakobranchus ocellatus]|uniref:Chitin binding beak protein 1 n=1 Tax=Plakobranchus ocellatus TaxID=259542 RepID=A0AAV4CCH9_9GAST|nr:chitin binding beak protein 1 [Plakobranchus ocellatus]